MRNGWLRTGQFEILQIAKKNPRTFRSGSFVARAYFWNRRVTPPTVIG